MKKYILFGAVALISLSACREEDENVATRLTEIPISIVGKWTLTNTTIISGKTGATLLSQNVNDCDGKTTQDFLQSGTIVAHLFGKVGTTCTDFGTIDFPYSYNSSSKILKINDKDQEVVALKTDQLTYIDADYDTDLNNDGVKDKRYISFKR